MKSFSGHHREREDCLLAPGLGDYRAGPASAWLEVDESQPVAGIPNSTDIW
jgi:hypothetical protein